MRAFVAMPFVESLEPCWTTIQEVSNKREIELFRVDKQLSFERHIDIAIRREISKSDFMIALLTGDRQKEIPNPNVAFEVGYAQGLGMETVLLAEEAECLPFDFKQQRTCLYHGHLDQLQEGLDKELAMLKKMFVDTYSKNIKNFTQEIARCLRITLPSEYRLFKEDWGYYDEKLWYAVYYGQKRNLRYAMTLGQSDQVTIGCWLANLEIRASQKKFLKQQHDFLRKRLGREIYMNFEEIGSPPQSTKPETVEPATTEHAEGLKTSTNLSRQEQRNREFIKETLDLECRTPGTREALQVALRLTDLIEVLEPLQAEFSKTIP